MAANKKNYRDHDNLIYADSSILKEFGERAYQSLKPFYDLQQRMADSLSFIYKDNFIFGTKIEEALRPFNDFVPRLPELLRPLNDLQNKMTETTYLFQQIAQEHKFAAEAMLKDIAQSMIPINTVSDTLLTIMDTHQQQWSRMLDAIPDSVFTNINFTSIQMQYFNELATDVAYEIDSNDTIDLTDDEFHEVRDAIIRAADGIVVKLDEFLNKLMQYALIAAPNIKACIFAIILSLFSAYFNSYMLKNYPLELLSTQQKTEVLLQASQQTINKYPQEELNKCRLVRVTDLNVRSKPMIDAPIMTGLSFGDEVTIIKENEEWVLIQWSDKDEAQIKGWVKERYLTKPKINVPVAE